MDGDWDYNGHGRDDILWRNSNGAFTNWLAQGNGSFVSNDLNAHAVIPTAWHVQGPGTFWAQRNPAWASANVRNGWKADTSAPP